MREKNLSNFVITAIGMMAFGVGVGMLGGYIGAHATDPEGFMALGLAIFGMLAGYVLGTVLWLFVLKYAIRIPGSIIMGILAGLAWTGISIGVATMLNLSDNSSSVIVFIMFLLTPAAALLGFYVKRGPAS